MKFLTLVCCLLLTVSSLSASTIAITKDCLRTFQDEVVRAYEELETDTANCNSGESSTFVNRSLCRTEAQLSLGNSIDTAATDYSDCMGW